MTPVVLEPLLERDIVHRNLTGDVHHRLGVKRVHLSWVELGERAQIDAGRGSLGLDRAGVDAGDPSRVGVPETMFGGKAARRFLESGERQRCRDAEAGQVGFAALEESRPKAGTAELRRDIRLQESWALGALVLDSRRRPADELAVVFRGPIAAVRVRRLCCGRVPEPPLGSDAVRPNAVQEFGRRPEILAPALPHHDVEHRRPSSIIPEPAHPSPDGSLGLAGGGGHPLWAAPILCGVSRAG